MIREEYLKSLDTYTSDNKLKVTMWNDIEKNYTKSNRYYHTVTHLDNLLSEIISFKSKFQNWDTIVFAIAYHDYIYNTLMGNNEEKSAAFAVKQLKAIGFPEDQTSFCEQLILATKKHEASDQETNLFTDADLSILGADPETYQTYTQQIRKEYSIYPNLVYNPGRKKVLIHFLEMKSIYKTKEFADRYESVARVNLQTELNSLTNGTI